MTVLGAAPRQPTVCEKRAILAGLFITGTLTLFLLYTNSSIDSTWYESSIAEVSSTCPTVQALSRLLATVLGFITATPSKRAGIELLIRSTAYILGLFHVTTIAILTEGDVISEVFNAVSAGSAAKGPGISDILDLPQGSRSRLLSSIVSLSCLGIFSSALWTGALTPTRSTSVAESWVNLPSIHNMTLIERYSAMSEPGPVIATKDGTFSYSVGMRLVAPIVASGAAASLTVSEKATRKHPKLDNTQFSYDGRSFGVGSTVGIQDDAIRQMASARSYRFEEVGYICQVECQYDPTPLSKAPQQPLTVSLGISPNPDWPRRFLHIMASDEYQTLNATQCTVDLLPTLFQVSVEVQDKRIEVVPLRDVEFEDFDSRRILADTALRQLESISTVTTKSGGSVLGDAFLSSIGSWNDSFNQENHVPQERVALLGIQNAVTAMLDSVLEAYGAAQLVVGNLSEPTVSEVAIDVFVFGNQAHIVAVTALNVFIFLVFCFNFLQQRR